MGFFIGGFPVKSKSAGKIIGASTIGRDITERKRMEKLQEEAQAYAESIVETVREPLLILDKDLRVKSANRSFYQTFQVSKEETESQLIYDLGDKQWNIPKLCTLLEEILPRNTQFNDFEVEHTFPTIGRKFMLLNARRIYRETNRTEMVLLAIEDITDRRRMEARLAQERKNLEKANLELDSFVYTASHDLRAPLRGVSSFCTFLEEDYKDKLDEKGKKYLANIRKGTKRMGEMIESLLTLSRISRIENPYEEVKIKDLLDSVLQRVEFDLKEMKVDLKIQDNLPTIRCDRIKMAEVFLNLINNAIKFSSKDNKEPSRLDVGYADQGEEHRFYVKDNGIGIDPKYHEKIFGIFERLQPSEKYEGAGVGLSIVKRVAEDHGGRVWVESKPGQGATFYFTIPKKV